MPGHFSYGLRRSPLGSQAGDKQRHCFGQGLVVAASGEGDRQEVTVHFSGVGLKKLLVKYASLERIE